MNNRRRFLKFFYTIPAAVIAASMGLKAGPPAWAMKNIQELESKGWATRYFEGGRWHWVKHPLQSKEIRKMIENWERDE